MSKITVFVKARPGAAGILVERRCRCGMCFDTEGRTVSVTEDQLARLKADPQLVVTDTPVQSDSNANVSTGPVENLPAAAPKAEAPATAKTDKTAAAAAVSGQSPLMDGDSRAKAAKKAG